VKPGPTHLDTLTLTLLGYDYLVVTHTAYCDRGARWENKFRCGWVKQQRKRTGSMMTYKTSSTLTIMRVAGSATSAMRKPQR
jgi:hypothetical protein